MRPIEGRDQVEYAAIAREARHTFRNSMTSAGVLQRVHALAEHIRHERGFRVREDGVVCRVEVIE